jgi:hypothetical protein
MQSILPVVCRAAALLAAGVVAACQSMPDKATTAQEQRESMPRYAEETLERLYAEHPKAKAEIEAAAGYAVFHLNAVNAVILIGKEAGGDLSAGATLGTASVQQSFNPYVSTYQTTDFGFAVQANWGGTVYVLDPVLACDGGVCPAMSAGQSSR